MRQVIFIPEIFVVASRNGVHRNTSNSGQTGDSPVGVQTIRHVSCQWHGRGEHGDEKSQCASGDATENIVIRIGNNIGSRLRGVERKETRWLRNVSAADGGGPITVVECFAKRRSRGAHNRTQ